MGMNDQGYSSYHGMVAEVNTAMKEIGSLCDQLDMGETKKDLEAGRKKLMNHKFAVGFMGEFKRGKSTVINALLGQEIMPADILACTATMNRVTYDMTPHAQVIFSDGTAEEVPVDQIKEYVTKLTEESEKRAESVEEAVVYYPCQFCQNSVDIIDTPGLNDDDRMDRISEQVIPKLDAVIMVVVPGAPFGKSEADFVRTKLLASDLGRLIFLVNKIDTVRPRERERCIQGIREKIQTAVLDKMQEIYGEDSKEYKEAQAKMGDIRIFPISAIQALDGRLDGDDKLLEESGILEFESALRHMLTSERGALELAAPLAALMRAVYEVTHLAETRKSSLQMSGEKFQVRQQEALRKINELRETKKQEVKRIKNAGKDARMSLLPEAAALYSELESKLCRAVEQVNIDEASLANERGKKAAVQKLEEKINETLEKEFSYFCERMKSRVMEAVGKEAEHTTEFTLNFGKNMEETRMHMTGTEASGSKALVTDVASITIDALTNGIGLWGLSGAFKGYQLAGGKGAAVGLGVGIATTLGTALLLGPLGITGLPLCFIAGLASQKTGGLAVKKMFGGSMNHKAYLKIVEQLHTNIRMMTEDLKKSQQFERYIEQLTEDGFGYLSAVVEEECEKVLKETEATIARIQTDITKNELQKKQDMQKYEEMITSANKVAESILPVFQKVNESRSKTAAV